MTRMMMFLIALITVVPACARDQQGTTGGQHAMGQRQSQSEDAQYQQRAAQARAQAQQLEAQGKIGATDQQFLNKAAQDGALEVQLASLAIAKGSTPAVQQLGERMMKDHTKANEELQKLVDRQGLRIPSAPAEDEQATHQLA